jgi:hypothetical protein
MRVPGAVQHEAKRNDAPQIYRVAGQAHNSIARDRAASGLAVKAASRRRRRWPSSSLDRLRPMPQSAAAIEWIKLPPPWQDIEAPRG